MDFYCLSCREHKPGINDFNEVESKKGVKFYRAICPTCNKRLSKYAGALPGHAPKSGSSSEGNHKTLCTICNSEFKDLVEKDYIHWVDQKEIATKYNLSYDAVKRHCSYYNLKKKRAKNYLDLLDRMLEKAAIALPEKYRPTDIKEVIALKAKLEGELVDKHKVDITGSISQLSEDELKTALDKLGIPLACEQEESNEG